MGTLLLQRKAAPVFSVVTKEDYFAASELVRGRIRQPPSWHLKTIQDAMVLQYLHGVRNQSVGEVGGGESRVLPYLARANACTNIDPLDGRDRGPSSIDQRESAVVRTAVGASQDLIRDASFDILFSVSVLEHVSPSDLPRFWDDSLRIMKPGGFFIHLVDVYLGDGTHSWEAATHQFLRACGYPFELGLVTPLDPKRMEALDGPIVFASSFASNPDNSQHSWTTLLPTYRDIHLQGQTCTVLAAGWKSAAATLSLSASAA